MDTVISFLSLTLRTGRRIHGNTLVVNKSGTIRARSSLNEYTFLPIELTSRRTRWITQDALSFVVASTSATWYGSLDTFAVDGVIKVRAGRVLRCMSTVAFTVLSAFGTLSGLRDFPFAERSVKIVSSFLAATPGTRLGSEQCVTRTALKICDLGAGVSIRVVGVTIRASRVGAADSVLEDTRRANGVLVPDTHPALERVLLRTIWSQHAVAALKSGLAWACRRSTSLTFSASRDSSGRAAGRVFADTRTLIIDLVGPMTDRWKVVDAKTTLLAVTDGALWGLPVDTRSLFKNEGSRTLGARRRLALVGSLIVL